MRASKDDAQELKYFLCVNERASGEMINRDKSAVLISRNTSQFVTEDVRGTLNMSQEEKNERYLGMPVSVGKSRKKMFEYIKKKVWIRIQGWQQKLLSKAGKEILVKAMAQG